ncbi:MAG: hypothetical protein AAF968_24325 [Pseudomonadota bacterium]
MRAWFLLTLTLLLGSAAALAAERLVSVELNKLEADGENCQAYLVLNNATEDAFDELLLDLVMFDPEGIIVRRLAVDIAPLPAGRTAVKVFSVQTVACERIGRVLLNGVLACEARGAAREGCLGLLNTSSRTGVELIN